MNKRQRIASYALIVFQGHVLLTQHGRGPNKGRWGLPGGGIEYGENPIDSLEREVFEEAGIVATHYVLDDVISSIIQIELNDDHPEELHNVGLLYRAQVASLLTVKPDADGHSSLGSRWFKVAELHESDVSPPIRGYLRKNHILK